MKTGWGTVGVAALVASCLQITACDIPVACPAIGYVSTITVNLEGDIAGVDEVKVCTAEGCSEPEPMPAPPGPKKTIVPAPVPEPEPEPEPSLTAPTVVPPPFRSRRTDPDTWAFTVSTGLPERVTVRALASDGAVLADRKMTCSGSGSAARLSVEGR
ncbi:hypothetical protein [Arthrobacter sp. ISL-30]|uniref:hypothetical protein n=1 Tax=Arthrobacter sp. ISL-30 TaxID=2819109 RepID=UPI001BE4E52B|nr:hypothetical protein [Arthrobacter sp. ISL-30]MBT2512862.1 hypothetical protein [Arthrobacter sp. ISL-30]